MSFEKIEFPGPGERKYLLSEEAYSDLCLRAAKYSEMKLCEDCISRKDALDYFRTIWKQSGEEKIRLADVITALTDLRSVQTKRQRGEWIPLSELKPSEGWHLFTDGSNISVERYKEDAIDHFYPSGRWFELEEVLAWMPLPEQYKGEK